MITTRKIPWRTFGIGTISITMFLYQVDYAYLNKSNRISDLRSEIINDVSYWFVPIDAPLNEDENSKQMK